MATVLTNGQTSFEFLHARELLRRSFRSARVAHAAVMIKKL